ncbi:zinc ABC transporter substrate-binding protein [Calidifontimicrobium sp. SYSU G02091]|uniref:metal ABC transporter solute-binding protein, Zn/Mn family n=1 Tax=Calidifontimicrobium sp. SYSU G02091 TaxID=2926421 RepID=UPI001F52D9ED|nr:zinc ABC transporter substrate-binding protein [Calidifontimicrobium sp. SYSU G02091]MCI1191110.1 zinc ABC transporter substrate-binding protein [Calidifontimicrobium sp. SYSU G02091]
MKIDVACSAVPPAIGPRGMLGWRLVAGLAIALSAGLPVRAMSVFACEAEWAALTRVLLPQAEVLAATNVRQDPHQIEPRPALIAQLRRADLAVCTGAELEQGWLPTLQQRAANPRVQDAAPGMFYAEEVVELLDDRPAPGSAWNPFAGHVHVRGNPHIHLDPRHMIPIARALAARIGEIDPAQAEPVRQRLRAFEADWQQRILAWEAQAAPLRGKRVAVQHGTFAYLWRWLGIVVAADLEPVPGMPPTPGHLQQVLKTLHADPPAGIVVASYQDPRPAHWLAQRLPAPSGGMVLQPIVLPATVDDPSQPDALARWFDKVVGTLRERLH